MTDPVLLWKLTLSSTLMFSLITVLDYWSLPIPMRHLVFKWYWVAFNALASVGLSWIFALFAGAVQL